MAESLFLWMIFILGLLAGKQFSDFFLKCKQNQSSEKKKKVFHLNDGDLSVKLPTSCWRSWRGNSAIRCGPSFLCSYQFRIVSSHARCFALATLHVNHLQCTFYCFGDSLFSVCKGNQERGRQADRRSMLSPLCSWEWSCAGPWQRIMES